jgi:uncharacterized protein YaeQ
VKIRGELHFNGEERRPFLMSGPSEPDDHVAHKLGAYILFWGHDPITDASTKLPALSGYEFLPDLLGLDDGGNIALWVECGSTTLHKLTKVTRRASRARVVVMKENERSAEMLRKELLSSFDRPERIEVLAWPDKSYKEWVALVGDRAEGSGESDGRMINGVVNDQPVLIEFKSY